MADTVPIKKNFVIPAISSVRGITPVEPKSLDDEEKELIAKLAEVKRKKEEAARLAEASKVIEIEAYDLSGAYVLTKAPYRADLVELLRKIDGRLYRGESVNGIPIGLWYKFKEEVEKLPNVILKYRGALEKQIEFYLNAPVWSVELEKRNLKLTPGVRYNSYDVNTIPGIIWKPEQKYFTLPLSEAWRLFKSLEQVDGVVWSDEARDFTIKQVEMRGKLDEIGQAKDWDYEVALKNGSLRPFQKVGCAFIEATGGNTLLAYQMGLGKTWISLAYAIKNKLRTIIVCPASLKNNWCREIYNLSGQKPLVLMGGEPTNYDLVSLIKGDHQFVVINYDILGRRTEYDDVTVNAEGFKHQKHVDRFLWVDAINMAKFDLVISDEGHYIKNTDSNRSQAVRRLVSPRFVFMTGTPVLNRPGEIWPMLTMLAPDTFPAEETFLSQYTFDGKSAKNVDKLRESLKSIMIRRKQEDVVDDMPALNRVTEYHELSKKAKKLYDKVEMGIYETISSYNPHGSGGGVESSITSILAKIQRLKQVCAIDKVDRTADLAMRLVDSALESKHNKVLIFSQYKAVAYAIGVRLGHEALSFVTRGRSDFVTADNTEQDRLIQQFQNDDTIKYLIVTEKTAKEGHNITKAGYVIFNDLFWTPAAHEQGEGRAYMRLSDPHGIEAYYTITDMDGDSIEEWIWEMLQSKLRIINQVVEGVEGSRDTSIAMELINKMKESMWRKK